MTPLERRAWWLLRAYPERWRDERGDEMVGTVVDLCEGRQWPQPRLAVDLLVGGWSERARHHRAVAGGWLAAGWRVATVTAVVVQVAVALTWLWAWSRAGGVPMLPVLGGASELTYLFALVGFVIATIAWFGGWATAARAVSVSALVSWALTVFVFQLMLAGGTGNDLRLVAWTYLAVLATWAMWQPRPTYPLAVGSLILVVSAGVLGWAASAPTAAPGLLRVEGYALTLLAWPSAATLHTLLVAGWTCWAIGAIVVAPRDPRAVVAAGCLLPFVALAHPPVPGATGNLAVAGLAVAVLAAAVLAVRQVGRAP